MDSSIGIPPELEATALRRFDSLVAKGEISYEQPRTSVISAQGLQVLERRSMADSRVIALRPVGAKNHVLRSSTVT